MDTSKLERMGRRRFIENLAGIGVSATTLQYLEQDELSDVTHDPEDEMPYVAALLNSGREDDGSVQREPVYETISREEWERRQTAFNAKDQIGRYLESLPGEYRVGVTSLEASPTGFGVTVGVPETYESLDRVDTSEVEEMLPSELTGQIPNIDEDLEHQNIPVIVNTDKDNLTDGYNTNTNYEEVPAGVAISTSVTGGSLGAPFNSNEHGDGWTTAGHVVKGSPFSSGDANTNVYESSPNPEDWIGESKDGYFDLLDLDYAFVEPLKDGETPSQWIVSPDGSSKEFPIGGIVTNTALENNVGNQNYEIFGQGASSGRGSGYIDSVNGINETSSVTTTNDMSDGDSGGPLFHEIGGTALIAGIMFEDVSAGAKSTTAQRVEDELGGSFLGSI